MGTFEIGIGRHRMDEVIRDLSRISELFPKYLKLLTALLRSTFQTSAVSIITSSYQCITDVR